MENTNEKNTTEKIIRAEHHDPFVLLGVHYDTTAPGIATFRTYQPHARAVDLLVDGREHQMERIHSEGLFAITVPLEKLATTDLSPYDYQYRIIFEDGSHTLNNDPYRFLPQLHEDDAYLFNYGTNYRLYDHLGAHPTTIANVSGTLFRVWAPAAKRVSVVGLFNKWDGRVHALRSLGSSGIWELFIPGIGENTLYKYEIKAQNNDILLKSDPFQFYGELRPTRHQSLWIFITINGTMTIGGTKKPPPLPTRSRLPYTKYIPDHGCAIRHHPRDFSASGKWPIRL